MALSDRESSHTQGANVTASVAVVLFVAQVTSFQASQTTPRDTLTTKGTASVKGKVVAADTGKPVRRVQITISSPDLTESRSMSTTALGVFEFKELPAGRYTISASRAGFLRLQYGQRRQGEPGRPVQLAEGQQLADVNFSMPRTGSIAGRITDEVGDPLPGVNIFPAQWRYFRGKRRLVRVTGGVTFNQTDDTGQYRITGLEPGDYFVAATTRETWTVDADPKERIGFLMTFSGGTANASDAQRIRVAMGQEAAAPDFSMIPGRAASISGTATTSAGMPLAGESVSVTQEMASPNGSMSFGMPGAKINPDGTFSVKTLAPGEYRLSVRAPGDKEHPPEGVTMTVTLAGEDLSGVALVTGAGGTLTGRIVTDTNAPLPAVDLTRMRVSSRPVDPTRTYTTFDNDNGRVKDDGAFELANVFGVNRLSVSPLPNGWAIKTIDQDGRDLADVPVDVSAGQRLGNITVILSKTLPKILGTLLDSGGAPAEGTVLIFPDDQQKWAEESRLVRTVRPDLTGAFEFRNVIPGDYLAVGLEYVREGDWADPEFLQNLRERAKPIRVGDAGAADIRLVLPKPQNQD